MIVERTFPTSFVELAGLVRRVKKAGPHAIAVQAGHFLLYYDHTEDLLLPCVREELTAPRHSVIMNSVGIFPLLTWKLGIGLLAAFEDERKAMLCVVNDWQYLPKEIDRGRFFKNQGGLFQSYRNEMVTCSGLALLTQRELGLKVNSGVWFSETSLRNQFKRQMEKLIRTGFLPPAIEKAGFGNSLSCSLVDAVGNRQEVYCSGRRPSCTQEIAELVRQVCAVGEFDTFVNFFPLVCKQYVQAGTELAFDLFRLKRATVINVGMPSGGVESATDLFKATEVSVHQSPFGGVNHESKKEE